MKKITVVGNGFSAAIAKLRINSKNLEFIAVNNAFFLKKFFVRKKSIEVNKIFLEKARSYSNTSYDLKNLILPAINLKQI